MLMLLLMGLGGASSEVAAPDAREAFTRLPVNGHEGMPYGSTMTPATTTLQEIPDSFTLVGENALFQLYANPETLAFKLLDKRSGYIWHSNLDEVGEDDQLNRTWTAFAQSGISIDYLDQKATDERASITNAEHTLDFEPINQGFAATVTFTEPGITLKVVVQLEESGVRVEVPFEAIREENPAYKLGLLHLYPFFGATREDSIPGYMFIPDGAGSLIEFAATTKAENMFYGRYYGPDLGMITYLPFDPLSKRPYRISIPVIGMVHGEKENGYVAIVEKGAAYGEIHAHPAGVTTNFNFLYNTFVYNESYFQATNRSGAGVTTLQPATNEFDVAIHYRFLTGDDSDYVGMAQSYQQHLLEKGRLQPLAAADGEMGIRLEFLGGEKEKVLFWHRLIPMTTIAQMNDILGRLDVQDPEVIYYGWQPLGAAAMSPRSLKLAGGLGNRAQLQEVIEEVTAVGGNFYLYLDPQAAIWDEGGYSTRRDLAMSITNANLDGWNRGKGNYYLNLEALNERYRSLSADVFTELPAGLALDGFGSTVYSDFKRNHFLNREKAIQAYQTLLGETGGRTAFYEPNDYVFGYMQAYFDMPLDDSGYLYTTQTVPFLPIVLAGYVPYFGTPLNFSSNLRQDLLRHADYGAYPSYFLTEAPTADILHTASDWLYSSSYDQWGQEVGETYQWLNNLLGPVEGERMIAREALAAGVVAVTYSNGRQIIINYNQTPFSGEDLFVNAEDAIIREVTP
jgi:hypothetical protein